MPLVYTILFFALLFSGEALFFSARRSSERMQLKRYQQVEHPRFRQADSYIDQLA